MADEADAERAVRAGLAVIDAIGPASIRGEFVQVRVGIATGLVVVGNLIGTGPAREHAVVGEAQISRPICKRWLTREHS